MRKYFIYYLSQTISIYNHFRFRYYPILASLQFQDIKVRSLTFVYIISITIFMSIHDNSYIYWLSLERTNLHMVGIFIDLSRINLRILEYGLVVIGI